MPPSRSRACRDDQRRLQAGSDRVEEGVELGVRLPAVAVDHRADQVRGLDQRLLPMRVGASPAQRAQRASDLVDERADIGHQGAHHRAS
jgi:hypothetical protein